MSGLWDVLPCHEIEKCFKMVLIRRLVNGSAVELGTSLWGCMIFLIYEKTLGRFSRFRLKWYRDMSNKGVSSSYMSRELLSIFSIVLSRVQTSAGHAEECTH